MTNHDRDRAWAQWAMRVIEADFRRSADTHLLPVHLPAFPGIRLYLKDESTHVTGSLKHRLARSLFLYALANGNLREGTLVVEASSGSTAISEAYFARMLGCRSSRSCRPARRGRRSRSSSRTAAAATWSRTRAPVYAVAAQIAAEGGGHYMDQFTFAERATDWRGNNNIAETIFEQMSRGGAPDPALDGGRRRHRRHRVDARALHPLSGSCDAAVRGRPRAFGHLRLLPHRRRDAARSSVARASKASAGHGSSPRSSARSSTA